MKITVQIEYEGKNPQTPDVTPQDIFNSFGFSIWNVKSVVIVPKEDGENAAVSCPSCYHSFLVSV